ncbi:hypothetical protein BD410DRAFT_353285 [Rickenella mellea]|uniref:Uncharacterized protein n=1 Tax=Rickenella mellea TaxID=50990 RepID=A0A4Y7QMX0_9AGAM|nr:hypothetical protein BD410DRAFT_353285 [Rickenella mellea]
MPGKRVVECLNYNVVASLYVAISASSALLCFPPPRRSLYLLSLGCLVPSAALGVSGMF